MFQGGGQGWETAPSKERLRCCVGDWKVGVSKTTPFFRLHLCVSVSLCFSVDAFVCCLLSVECTCMIWTYWIHVCHECRGSSVERGGKKGSRGDEKRARGIKNQVRSNLYLTGNCETAKYKKTFPISALCWCIYSPGLCVCLYVSVFMCRVCVYLEIAFPPQWRETSLCWWAWVVVGPEGLSSVSVSWLVAVWPIRSPGHTVAIR